jgi:hypothetical protein
MSALLVRAFGLVESGWVGPISALAQVLHREGYSLAELHQLTGAGLRKQLQTAMRQAALKNADASVRPAVAPAGTAAEF